LWLHSLKVAQLLRSAACLHTNQSRSYLNHLVHQSFYMISTSRIPGINYFCTAAFLYPYILDISDRSMDFNKSSLNTNLHANHEPPSSMKNTANIIGII